MRINNEDFYIQLVPDLDKNKNWLGTLQVNIVTSNVNPIDDDGYNQIFHLCQLISSVVPYMDDNPDIIAELEKYMKVEQKSNKSTKKIVSKQGNVINLNFKSKTNGSA
jgi:hypothetical protein|tara:strand:+ start:1351 stop:1674 length:324 start_codon:yes stop_codon:yes gene_type:complete